MKTLTDFALKDECKHLQLVKDKLAKIDSLIGWNSSKSPNSSKLDRLYTNIMKAYVDNLKPNVS
jgi:hypothetical protein